MSKRLVLFALAVLAGLLAGALITIARIHIGG